MKTRNEYIGLLRASASFLKEHFGVRSLRLFGSVARNEQHEGSDVDVCVDMQPNLFRRIEMKDYLEQLLGCSVDVIREHKNMNTFLKSQIEKDGIYVFQ